MKAEILGQPSGSHFGRLSSFLLECRCSDSALRHQGRVIAALCLIIMTAALVAFGIFGVALGEPLESWPDLAGVICFTLIYWDNRRGNVRRSAILTQAFMFLLMNLFTSEVAKDPTSRYISCFYWVIPIFLAGATLTWRWVIVSTVASLFNITLVWYFFLAHLEPLGPLTWGMRWVSCTIVFVCAASLCAVNRYQADQYQRDLQLRHNELDQVNNRLESEVQKRTNDLVVARDLALSASRTKSEILVNMSHEFRTPMNAVLGNLDLLLETELDSRQQEFLNDLRESSTSLLGLIDDMLEFSSLDMEQNAKDARPFEVRPWFATTLERFLVRARNKGLAVVTEIEADVPTTVLGDSRRLRRILANLVDNAIKFTSKGEIGISLKVQKMVGDDLHLEFNVRDSGIGIAADRMGQIFEAFGQVDASLKRQTGGVGLGLALCKRLAERMGGRIWMTSELDKGSAFGFEVVVQRTQVLHPASSSVPEKPLTVVAVSNDDIARPCSILLAEDNVVNQRLAMAMLKKLGYQPDLAVNGLEAVRAVAEKAYDVILMDVQMPEMDGLEATRAILARTQTSRKPVIIGFTAHTLLADRERCYDAGMVDIVSKPTNLPDLRAAIWRAIERAA